VSVLAHVFEAAGIATVALGSIRGQMVRTAPPRGLWCDFPLGRPLGAPDDPALQHRVLERALRLLETATGPVVEEFDERVVDDGDGVLACPLPPRDDAGAHPAAAEARGLRPAYERAVERLQGRAGAQRTIGPDEVPDALEAFGRVAAGTPWKEAGIPGAPARVAQDIRGYYEAAALGLVDHTPAAWEATRWFLEQTEGGRTIRAARTAMQDAGERTPIWFYLVPAGI
jgi:hypothetical protein